MPKRKLSDPSKNWKKLQLELGIKPSKKKKTSASIPKKTCEKPEIWFDGVDETLLPPEHRKSFSTIMDPKNPLEKTTSFQGPTHALAIDCEMVGVGDDGRDNMLARVSLVNQFGKCIYDKYVTPQEPVTDYRTYVSGIRPHHLAKGELFSVVQKEVHDLIKDRILVGHALKNDLKVLMLDHPYKLIRDTAKHKPFKRLFQGRTPSLKNLTEKLISVKVQEGEHDSVQDAQAAMRIYTLYRKNWERELTLRKHFRAHKLKEPRVEIGFGLSQTANVNTGKHKRKLKKAPKAVVSEKAQESDSDSSDD